MGYWEGDTVSYRRRNTGPWEGSWEGDDNTYKRSNQTGRWEGPWADLRTRRDLTEYWEGDTVPHRRRNTDSREGS